MSASGSSSRVLARFASATMGAVLTHPDRFERSALTRLSAGRTTLSIAHRLATVVDADQVLVLEGGRIVEQGRHTSCSPAAATTTQMWARQQAAPAA